MDNNMTALKVAEYLLQIEAVRLRPENPFTWASGLRSPIYCDNRKTLSYPDVRAYLKHAFANRIREQYPMAECIAGVATGGIAIGALIAEELNLPFIYVRSEAKKHGLGNQVEGVLHPDTKVVVIEDLISTGKSSLQAVEALRDADADVLGLIAIFSYGFQQAAEQFAQADCTFETLSGYDFLLNQATQSGKITEAQRAELADWKSNPSQWSERYLQNQTHH
ncbi:MAG: orotate phosphoribosyltransferase [Flavobacteriales bacterium]